MALSLAKLGHALLLSLLLFLPLAHRPAAQRAEATPLPRPGPPAGLLPLQALPPEGGLSAGVPAAIRPGSGGAGANLAGEAIAGDATPISERRARAVAMTVFSLSTVVGAGFLAFFLIKRLL